MRTRRTAHMSSPYPRVRVRTPAGMHVYPTRPHPTTPTPDPAEQVYAAALTASEQDETTSLRLLWQVSNSLCHDCDVLFHTLVYELGMDLANVRALVMVDAVFQHCSRLMHPL